MIPADRQTGSAEPDVLDSDDCEDEFAAGVVIGVLAMVALIVFEFALSWLLARYVFPHGPVSCWFQIPAGDSCQTP